MQDPLAQRRTGVLLHPTSLPGHAAQGRLNQEAINFLDFLASCSVTIWQILPLGPTHADGSPYQSYSSFALNPKLIDWTFIEHFHWFDHPDQARQIKDIESLSEIYSYFDKTANQSAQSEFSQFSINHADWLEDYALFRVLKSIHNEKAWYEWPKAHRTRDHQTLLEIKTEHKQALDGVYFEQFMLFSTWLKIKAHAKKKKIAIFGDIPIFVSHDSADVWSNQPLFALDHDGQLLTVAGVPPDYFSETGQRWGNPHYNWEEMKNDNFAWWIKRLSHNLELYDLVRIDHFRGLEAYWEISADEETAINGRWIKAPGEALLASFQQLIDNDENTLPIVAEDLGIITPEVEALRDKYELPGMKILHFAFDSDNQNPYLPHMHTQRSVVYTGTHDNDTTVGWFNTVEESTKTNCLEYLMNPKDDMPWPLIQTALASVAQTAIIPMQDLLELDSNHRMNTPGTSEGNWLWRFQWKDVPEALPRKLKSLNKMYARDLAR